MPYHGLVSDDSLTLPNSTQISYPGITKGDTQLVQVPNLPLVNRTPRQKALDETNGFEWRNYALVTDNRIGHVNLNDPLYQWIIYIDDNNVPWHLRFGFSLTNFQTAHMWCEVHQPFGRIAKEHPISQLPNLVSKNAAINGAFLHRNRFTLERNIRGSEVLVHLYARSTGNPGINILIDFPSEDQFQSPWGLYEVWKLKIFGAGLVTDDVNRLGEGITATLEPYLIFGDIQKRETINNPRQEISLRANHTSHESSQEGEPPMPPNCESTSVSFHENWSHGLTDINTPSQGGYFFNNENIVHKVYDWNGLEIRNSNIVRVLFDKDGLEHRIAVRNTIKSLNKKDVTISGRGYQNILDATYQLDSGACKQQPSPYDRGLSLTTNIIQQTKVVEGTEVLVNDAVVKSLELQETRTYTETQTRTITESGTYIPSSFTPFQADTYDDHTESDLNADIEILSNDIFLRSFSGLPVEIPVSPFTGSLAGDDPDGIYKTLKLGFVSNNVIGLALKSYHGKDQLETPVSKRIQCLSVPNILSEEVEWVGNQIYGSFQPVEQKMAVNFLDPIAWV